MSRGKLHPLEIDDEFTHLSVSREWKRQLRAARDGKCITCGRAKGRNKRRCNRCMKKDRERWR